MFRKAGHGQNRMWCRMLISRACTAVTVFGLPAGRREGD